MRLTAFRPAGAMIFFALAYANLFTAAVAGAEASAKMDPCSLLSGAEARSILGVEFGTPTSTDDGLMRNCVYASADKRKTLMLQAKTTDQALFERWMKLRGNQVPKLGGDAYTNSGVLLVWKNGTEVHVKVSDQSGKSSAEQLESSEETVASLILQRL